MIIVMIETCGDMYNKTEYKHVDIRFTYLLLC
jgi:hypothetical protein